MGQLKQNRYFGLIVALIIWLVILSFGFLATYQWSQKNIRALENVDYIGDISDAMLHIGVHSNNLLALESEDSERKNKLIEEIDKYIVEVDDNLKYMFEHTEMMAELGLDGKINELSSQWKTFREKLERIKSKKREDELDLANYIYERLSINYYDLVGPIYYGYYEESQNIIRKSNYLQAGLALFSVIYFIFLLLVYVKRFIRVDAELAVAQREMSDIMATVNTGLFLLERDLSIGQLRSHRLYEFLGDEHLEGLGLVDVLQTIIRDRDLILSTEEFIEQLYNPKVKAKLIESLNPLDQVEVMLNKRQRYLRFDFKRVYEQSEISKVLVNISDITSDVLLAEQLKSERSSGGSYLPMLKAIQVGDRVTVQDFLLNSQKSCVQINELLREQAYEQHTLRIKTEQIWRLVHSLKGEASALKLSVFQELCEKFEEELKAKQQQKNLQGEHFLGLVVLLEELINLTQVMSSLLCNPHVKQPAETASQAKQAISEKSDSQSAYYQEFVHDLAERQGKNVVCHVDGIQLVSEEWRSIIRSIAVQIVRNAVVHGIESPTERSALGKRETGVVNIRISQQNKALCLDIEDDGRGLDYGAIRKKAVELGWYTPEQAQQLDSKALLGIMFRSQLSTAEKQDGDAGRGVGLDMVKHTVQQHGGQLKVSTQAGRYTRFTFVFPQENAG
ncbi:MAG: ATP-binding protein [Cardiobacteriaceae bacterium]|nr:ATP-binding protein [Cardiobacteriaceae bacterium]